MKSNKQVKAMICSVMSDPDFPTLKFYYDDIGLMVDFEDDGLGCQYVDNLGTVSIKACD